MDTIKFHVVVNEDQVIRPPAGVCLPQGELEVTVRSLPVPQASPSSEDNSDPLAATRSWLLDIATEVERAAPGLPADLAERHDHYAHGKPDP
jgi:hypothetical protein